MRLLLLLPLLAFQDPAVTSDRFTPLRTSLAEQVESGAFRGAVVALDVKGERVLEHGVELETDTVFRIFSMTKPITAVAALILVEEDELDLDAPVGEYLPAFRDQKVAVHVRDPESGERRLQQVPVEQPMTVRDLMRHTSGLTYGAFGVSAVDKMVNEANLYDRDLAELARKLGALPLKHQPGTCFEYSLSSDVLGRVVEVVSGQTLDVFFDERIFAPLGMDDTGFHVDEEALDRVAPVHGRSSGELVERKGAGLPPPRDKPAVLLGGAGLYSTADDYLLFCRMLLGGGALAGKRILEAETVAEMMTDQLGERPGSVLLRGSGFGLGLAVVRQEPRGPGPSAGTCWWGGAAGTGFWIDPERELAGVFMIQNWMELSHWARFQREAYKALDD